jgi:hypothetical protein
MANEHLGCFTCRSEGATFASLHATYHTKCYSLTTRGSLQTICRLSRPWCMSRWVSCISRRPLTDSKRALYPLIGLVSLHTADPASVLCMIAFNFVCILCAVPDQFAADRRTYVCYSCMSLPGTIPIYFAQGTRFAQTPVR